MRRYYSFAAIFAASFLGACGASRMVSTPVHRTLDTVTVSAGHQPLDLYRATPTLFWDILHTRVALSFNMPERTAEGSAWITLRPYWYATDTLTLDAKSMVIDSVMYYDGIQYQPLAFNYTNDKLGIKFAKRFERTQKIDILVKYTARPYATHSGGSRAITADRGLYFINTNHEVPKKPIQIWTQGETEANAHWLPTIDQPNERTTVQLELTVPDSFKTLSNGALLRSLAIGKGLRTDVWAMQQPIQIYAIMFAIGDFTVVEDRPFMGVAVNYYVEPPFASYAKKMFNHTPEMIEYFSEITGVPYPWNKYSQVVVRDYVSGAMENTTASLYGEFMNQNFREIADKNYEDVVAHELFHQWFGDYVTAESWSNLTINESFANYGQQLWRGYKYGKATSDELALNDLSRYLGQTRYNDEPLVRFHYAEREDMFDRISYEKGGAILRYLHGLMGDDAFRMSMKTFLTQNALKSAEAHQWRLAIEEVTGEDWNWFFNQWYFRGGHPQLQLSYNYDDQAGVLQVSVKQTTSDSGHAFDLPMKAALIYGNSMEVIDWRVSAKTQDFSFPFKRGVKPVFVPDYHNWLVGSIKEEKTSAQWLQQLQVMPDYVNKRRAVAAAFQMAADTGAVTIVRHALNDTFEGIRAYTLSSLARTAERSTWQQQLKEQVSMLAINGRSHRERASALEVLGKWKIAVMKPSIMGALADSSYMVAGSALEALHQLDKEKAYEHAKNLYRQQPRAHLETAIWQVLAAKGAAEDVALFADKADDVYGSRKMTFANFVHLYSINTTSTRAYEQALEVIAMLTKRESIKSYRFAMGALLFTNASYYADQAIANNAGDRLKLIKERKAIADRLAAEVLKAETDPDNVQRYQKL